MSLNSRLPFLLRHLDPLGNLIRYEYNSDGKLAASYDPEWTPGSQGHSHQIIYPALNSGDVRTSTFTEKDGGVWTKTYDVTISKIKEKIAPDGIRTSYTHYPDGTLKSKTEPGADNINYTTFYTYDANGNVSSETDPTDCTALGIDPATVSTTDPRLKVAHRYSYDLTNQNRMLSSSDLRGAVPLTTGYQYSTDANGILTTDTEEQALARVRQKGGDCAEAAVEMANLAREIRNEKRSA